MLRLLIRETAAAMDTMSRNDVNTKLSDRVSMCKSVQVRRLPNSMAAGNYRANRLATDAADFAIQVHGGMGYSRHMPLGMLRSCFMGRSANVLPEHLWRHHRRYRITEGSEQIQMRNVAKGLFSMLPVALYKR
jgi:acyl-CoA dehydrogenase